MDVELTGQTIDGRYRVERRIGSGGMGTVWRAQHVQTLQRFAIKTLRVTEAFPEGAVQRCLKEARAAAALRSRHVVRVIDVQPNYTHRGVPLPYLAMELLEGIDFESVLVKRQSLRASEVAWVMIQVCRGIQLAHEQGIVHRDLKPANLFLTTDEDGAPLVKICDFGLAKLDRGMRDTSSGGLTTEPGTIVGTPRYMAPEQLRGPLRATPSLDQWAIGLIAYRLLSGEDYFGNALTPVDLSLRIVHDDLPLPSERSPLIPSNFDVWFLRSCARDPIDRFESVKDQSDALLSALDIQAPVALNPLAPSLFHHCGDELAVATPTCATLALSASGKSRRTRGMYLALGISTVLSAIATVAAASWFEKWPRHVIYSAHAFAAMPASAASSDAATSNAEHFQDARSASSVSSVAPREPERSVLDSTEHRKGSKVLPQARIGARFPSTAFGSSANPAPIEASGRPRATATLQAEGLVPQPRMPTAPTTMATTTRGSEAIAPSGSASPAKGSTFGFEAGRPCSRSSQCTSRLCVAERCR